MISFVYRFFPGWRRDSEQKAVRDDRATLDQSAFKAVEVRNMCVPASNFGSIAEEEILQIDFAEKLKLTDSTLSCEECCREFRSAQGLRTHMRQVHELKKYADICKPVAELACDICSKTFRNSEALWQHKISKHEGAGHLERDLPDWKQEVLKKTQDLVVEKQQRVTDLKNQGVTKIFEDEGFYACPVCQQAVPLEWDLEKHLTTLQPLLGVAAECDCCGKKFIEYRALKQHMNYCRKKSNKF